jgi:hypothetical protein
MRSLPSCSNLAPHPARLLILTGTPRALPGNRIASAQRYPETSPPCSHASLCPASDAYSPDRHRTLIDSSSSLPQPTPPSREVGPIGFGHARTPHSRRMMRPGQAASWGLRGASRRVRHDAVGPGRAWWGWGGGEPEGGPPDALK